MLDRPEDRLSIPEPVSKFYTDESPRSGITNLIGSSDDGFYASSGIVLYLQESPMPATIESF
ncbi:MAG: hypothetical protein AB4426_32815 [Xenococcaceae cyanobacterium]